MLETSSKARVTVISSKIGDRHPQRHSTTNARRQRSIGAAEIEEGRTVPGTKKANKQVRATLMESIVEVGSDSHVTVGLDD